MTTSRAVSDVVCRQAEKQLRNWSLQTEIVDRIEHDLPNFATSLRPYVALSRETGSGASEVAELVAAELGCELLDRELLHQLAKQTNISEDQLLRCDETSSDWMSQLLNHWLDCEPLSRSRYLSLLRLLLLRSARASSHVIVGRGAQFLLPRESGIAVRLVAPLRQRIERVMHKYNWLRDKAEAHIRATDHARDEFIRTSFHHNVTDPLLYDMVINMEFFSISAATDLIVQHFRRRF